MSFDFLTRKLSKLAMIWKLHENYNDADNYIDDDGDNDIDSVDEKYDDIVKGDCKEYVIGDDDLFSHSVSPKI